jgi:hypothetical protein
MLSYIILFTNEYRYVIALVFLLSHFTLKFCLKILATMRGVSLSIKVWFILKLFLEKQH